MISTTIVNFVCLKWGSKYSAEDVNNLYDSLLNNFTAPFFFTCYTDDVTGINTNIMCKDINVLRPYPFNCFTVEKVFLFDSKYSGLANECVLLDLDIKIQRDLKPYIDEYDFCEPRFTINHKPKLDYVKFSNAFVNHGANFVNSSFVTWKDDQLKYMTDLFVNNRELIQYRYKDFDTAVFNLAHKKLKYHPPDVVYSHTSYKEHRDGYICLYNDSHL